MAKETSLPWSTRLVYGMGHIQNDLCAVLWFTYLLLFLEKVIGLDGVYAGVVLLSGQIVDGMATVPIGYLSDKGFNCWPFQKYGKRKTWHLFGTIGVLLHYPFLFLGCFGCNLGGPIWHTVYLSWFSCIHNIAWAAVQISHLAMIPELSPSQNERTGLTAIRHAAQVASNIAGYVLIWAILGIDNDPTESIGPESKDGFLYVLGILMAVGATTSIFFHIFIKSPAQEQTDQEQNCDVEQEESFIAKHGSVEPMSVLDWLREPQTYQVAIVYLVTRMFVNLTQMYLPFYLQETLKLPNSFVATIPLLIYVVGFAISTVMKYVNRKMGRKATFLLGCGLGWASCLWIFNGCNDVQTNGTWQIYAVAVLMGAGGSIMLITRQVHLYCFSAIENQFLLQ